MAAHSSTLAWQIPWTEEPGRLQSMGLLGIGYLSSFTSIKPSISPTEKAARCSQALLP